MRFSFFNSGFWGLMLIVLGMALLARHVFHIDIPVFSIFISLILIFLGIMLIQGRFSFFRSANTSAFSEARVHFSDQKSYNTLFGSTHFNIPADAVKEDTKLELNCAMGELVVKLPSELNYRIKGNAAFGSLQMPDGQQVSFGELNYEQGEPPQSAVLDIKVNVAFGSVRFFS